ncbi:O-antigen ligase family protein [Candidatus Roizmanbacteria bacterium]|nr:MAG: O-antigen ligase family protein [Candidatus Roizmanbacteria bacterium]
MRHRRTTASIVSVFLLSILLWLSYLRSAYLGMLVVIMVDYLTNNAVFKSIRNYKISLLVALVTVLFLLIPFADQTEIPVISQLRTVVIRDETAFHYKDFDNGRIGFITTALQAIRERPLTGYGGGNFYYASLYYSKNIDYVVSTSHNLFIDIAAEHGIVSFLTFALIIFVVTRKVIRQMRRKRVINNVIGSVFIGLFVLFEFNYYHLMAFLFVFFFICGALLYEEKASIHGSILLKSVSFLVALFGVGIFVSSYVNARGNSSLALRLYPINDKGYRYQIADLYRNQKFNQMEILINKYAYLYRDVPFDMSFLGRFNSSIGNNSKALQYYLSALNRAPRDTGYVVKVFELMSLVRSEEDARSYVEKHLREYTILYPEMQFEDRDWFSAWCHANNLDCYYEKSVRNQ